MADCDTREKIRLDLKWKVACDGLLSGREKKTQPRTSNKNSTKNSNQGGNRDQLRKTVRHQFNKNASLKDAAAIEAAKETAVRGLSNFMFQEAQRMAKDQTGAATKDG